MADRQNIFKAMKQEENSNDESEPSIPRKAPLAIVLLAAGISLLGFSMYRYVSQERQAGKVMLHTDSLLRVLDTAGPRFDVGYGEINRSLYKSMRAGTQDSSSLAFGVINNEIDRLSESGNLDTTCTSITSDNRFLKTYLEARKKNQMTQREPGIICLVVKQIGKGKAENVTLDYNSLTINQAHEMYDPTDIQFGTDSLLTPEDRKLYQVSRKQLNLGAMDTGAAILIPLYITNWFDRKHVKAGEDVTINLTGGPIWVPVTLTYARKKSKTQQILLSAVLQRPITISR